MSNIQISQELFNRIFAYFILDEKSSDQEAEIKKMLNEKLDKIIKHDLYSKYKSADLDPAEREKARNEYLEMIGMKSSFRW